MSSGSPRHEARGDWWAQAHLLRLKAGTDCRVVRAQDALLQLHFESVDEIPWPIFASGLGTRRLRNDKQASTGTVTMRPSVTLTTGMRRDIQGPGYPGYILLQQMQQRDKYGDQRLTLTSRCAMQPSATGEWTVVVNELESPRCGRPEISDKRGDVSYDVPSC